eukprot:augustus_masked-scaffold_43-processed-gene-0.45-mRNA-1 protein AED:1.00 eAED:1.00 QI:0/-1/0/0/-1/1/1/0/898
MQEQKINSKLGRATRSSVRRSSLMRIQTPLPLDLSNIRPTEKSKILRQYANPNSKQRFSARRSVPQTLSHSTPLGVRSAGGLDLIKAGYAHVKKDKITSRFKKSFIILEKGAINFYNPKNVVNHQAVPTVLPPERSLSLTDLRAIGYTKRGAKSFGLVFGMNSSNISLLHSLSRFRRGNNSSKNRLGAREKESFGSESDFASTISHGKKTKTYYSEQVYLFKFESGNQAEQWLRYLFLELKNQAMFLEQSAMRLSDRPGRVKGAETMQRQAVDLYTLSLGRVNKTTAQSQVRLSRILKQSAMKDDEKLEAKFWKKSAAQVLSMLKEIDNVSKTSPDRPARRNGIAVLEFVVRRGDLIDPKSAIEQIQVETESLLKLKRYKDQIKRLDSELKRWKTRAILHGYGDTNSVPRSTDISRSSKGGRKTLTPKAKPQPFSFRERKIEKPTPQKKFDLEKLKIPTKFRRTLNEKKIEEEPTPTKNTIAKSVAQSQLGKDSLLDTDYDTQFTRKSLPSVLNETDLEDTEEPNFYDGSDTKTTRITATTEETGFSEFHADSPRQSNVSEGLDSTTKTEDYPDAEDDIWAFAEEGGFDSALDDFYLQGPLDDIESEASQVTKKVTKGLRKRSTKKNRYKKTRLYKRTSANVETSLTTRSKGSEPVTLNRGDQRVFQEVNTQKFVPNTFSKLYRGFAARNMKLDEASIQDMESVFSSPTVNFRMDRFEALSEVQRRPVHCFLLFSPANKGTLYLRWTREDISQQCLLKFKPGDGVHVPAYKLKTVFGDNPRRRDELIKGVDMDGGAGKIAKKKMCQGVLQFLKEAVKYKSTVTIYSDNVNFDVYGYEESTSSFEQLEFNEGLNFGTSLMFSAFCAAGRGSPVYRGLTRLSKAQFLDRGNRYGAVMDLS